MSGADDDIRRRDPRRERDRRRAQASELAAALPAPSAAPEPRAGAAIPRIDPRVRRAARSAAPATPAAADPAFGKTEPTRRDPRARRRDRGALSDAPASPASDTVRIDVPAFHVLVVADLERDRLSPADRIALGAARLLADTGGGAVALALLLPPQAEFSDDAGLAGADRVVTMRHAAFGSYDPDARAASAAAMAATLPARHVVLSETRLQGADIARRIAAALGGGLAVNVVRIADGAVISVIDAGRREATGPAPRVVVVDPAVFPAPARSARREARILAAPAVEIRPALRDDGLLPVDPRSLSLAEAELVLGAGDGVTDWEAFHALAAALQAAEAGSRVVCDAGHLPRSRQVGASGTLISAQCYLAAGISGSTQHLHGIADCRTVIAVNTDLHAAMIARAELAVIADAQQVMPALARLIEEKRRGP